MKITCVFSLFRWTGLSFGVFFSDAIFIGYQVIAQFVTELNVNIMRTIVSCVSDNYEDLIESLII
jgi:hypothetical protein